MTIEQIEKLNNIAYVYFKSYQQIVAITKSGQILEYWPREDRIEPYESRSKPVVKTCGNMHLDQNGNVFSGKNEFQIPSPEARDLICIREDVYLLDNIGRIWEYAIQPDHQPNKWVETGLTNITIVGHRSLYDDEGNVFAHIDDEFYKLANIPDVTQLVWIHHGSGSSRGKLHVIDSHKTMFEYNVVINYNFDSIALDPSNPVVYAENVDALFGQYPKRNNTKSARN